MINSSRVMLSVVAAVYIFQNAYGEIAGRFQPPNINDRVDYQGRRFFIRDQDGIVLGHSSRLFRENIQLREERPDDPQDNTPLAHTPYISPFKPKYLVRMSAGTPQTVKEIILFKDLQGFVQINTESDALEYVRFASSFLGPQFKDVKLMEIHCVPDNTQTFEPNQGTVSEFAQFGFLPPSITEMVNGKLTICHEPPGNQKNKSSSVVDFSALSIHLAHGDMVGTCDTERKDGNAKKPSSPKTGVIDELKTFIVVRTMYNRRHPGEFVRVVEEVKSDGQWRIIEIKKIDVSKKVALPIFLERGL